MYDVFKEMQEKMKPVTQLTEANQKAVETIFALQSEYFTNCLNAGLAQVKALAEVKEPKEAIQLQMSYLKDQEAKWTEVAEKELAALTEVREQMSALVEDSLMSLGDAPYFDPKQFEMPAMDMSAFDLSKFMPNVDTTAAQPKKPAASKPAARKASSASASAS
ncbi:phasin family protein [Marinobacterium sp. AK62]|uniref:Phasin family protein n=1 Tax=Marinobacterium alkalitolerans TaxID=1542925 RepID=A0ABS3ZBU3_9GAMM|nr:phasin family protein [Marinobacterium alkalitolerans]MBP0049176.1 phasin family protein [Marinobacterium alkalitolerans]